MKLEKLDSLRTTAGNIIIILSSIMLYIFIPFVYIYPAVIVVSAIAMFYDYYAEDFKQGMIIQVMKWTTLIPVVNAIPFLIIPVYSAINPIFNLIKRQYEK